MDTGRWLTVQQVAEILQVRIETVRRWIRRGDIPVLDIGGPRTVYRIRQVDLDEFVRDQYRPEERTPEPSNDAGTKSAALDGDGDEGIPTTNAAQDPRDLVDRMPAVTFREEQARSGSPTYLSREIESLLGYTVQEILDHPGAWLDMVHQDDRERVRAEMARTDETGEPFRMDYRMIRRDGEVIWLSVEAVLVDSDEEGARWEGAIIDITDHRLLEEALLRHHLQQQTIADLGRVALDGLPVASLLREAAARVCDTMHAARVIVYEVLPGGLKMVDRARAISQSASPATPGYDETTDPLSAFAAQQRTPVVSEKLAEDGRFSGERMESELGARSGVAIPIPGRIRPYGVLTVLFDERRAASQEELLFLQSVVNILGSSVAHADNHWLTVTEVADLLQVTEDTVRRWIRNLDLPALSLGGARAGYRVYPSDLERFIQHRLKRLT